MKVVFKTCCGVDVHKSFLVATIIKTTGGIEPSYQKKRFSTFNNSILEFKQWLLENNYRDVCMESTGKYWVPVFNLLEDEINVTITNPKWVKAVKGNKDDTKDFKWIGDLFRLGLVKGSYVPCKAIRVLREYTRYRYKLVSCRSSKKNRYQNALTVCNVALDSVVSDIFGKSSTSIIDHLLEQSGTLAFSRLYLAGQVLCIHIVQNVLERCNIVIIPIGVDSVIYGNIPYPLTAEIHVGVIAGLDIVSAKSAQVLGNDKIDLAAVNVLKQSCKCRSIKIQPRITVVRIDLVDGESSFVAEIRQHHFLRFNTDTFACLLVVLAESAIDCCAVNGLLIPHLFHKLLLSRNKVNPEIVRCLLLCQNVCSESMRQHLTETPPQKHPHFCVCLGRFRERSISPYA